MDTDKLAKHIKLCRSNLANKQTRCCATCPFETEIIGQYPDMAAIFEAKRLALASKVQPELKLTKKEKHEFAKQGRLAFESGKAHTDCPYDTEYNSVGWWWLHGWWKAFYKANPKQDFSPETAEAE